MLGLCRSLGLSVLGLCRSLGLSVLGLCRSLGLSVLCLCLLLLSIVSVGFITYDSPHGELVLVAYVSSLLTAIKHSFLNFNIYGLLTFLHILSPFSNGFSTHIFDLPSLWSPSKAPLKRSIFLSEKLKSA